MLPMGVSTSEDEVFSFLFLFSAHPSWLSSKHYYLLLLLLPPLFLWRTTSVCFIKPSCPPPPLQYRRCILRMTILDPGLHTYPVSRGYLHRRLTVSVVFSAHTHTHTHNTVHTYLGTLHTYSHSTHTRNSAFWVSLGLINWHFGYSPT